MIPKFTKILQYAHRPKESEIGGEMVSKFSGCDGNGVVCNGKVKASDLEVEETKNSEVGCVADFEKN